ncbi:MAG: M56 family metallopeptidase [bacterium]|nr:M56 family metallopeptidase [bacterium]
MQTILIEFLFKAACVWLIGFAAVYAARRGSAATRERIWRFVCVAVLLLPAAALLPGWSLPVAPAQVSPGRHAATEPIRADAVRGLPVPVEGPFAEPPLAPASVARATASDARLWPSVARSLAWIWLIGSALVLVPLLRGLLALWRWRRRAQPLSDECWSSELAAARAEHGLAREPRLLLGDGIRVPMVWGGLPGLRPFVALPPAAAQWDRARIRGVLLHELAHLRRRDGQMHMLARFAVALSWPLPFAWAAWRRMLALCERACDDLALELGERPSTYASHLLALAQGDADGFAATAMVRTRDLEGRIEAILDERCPRRPPGPRATGLAVLAALLVFVPIAAFGGVVAAELDAGLDEAEAAGESAQDRAARAAIERGVDFLVAAQDAESGAWRADIGYKLNSSYRTLTEGAPHVGVTALALTALLEAGARPWTDDARGRALARGTSFLLSVARTEPGYVQFQGSRMKGHALALTYLAKLVALRPDPDLRAAAQTVVDFTVRTQMAKGWRYQPYTMDGDIHVSALQLLALEAARDAGLDVPVRSLERARATIRAFADPETGTFRYQSGQHARVTVATTAAGWACLGTTELMEESTRKAGLAYLVREMPKHDERWFGHYVAWHASYLVAHALRTWPEAETAKLAAGLHERLLKSQAKDGSWPNRAGPGLAYSTAVGCILLAR